MRNHVSCACLLIANFAAVAHAQRVVEADLAITDVNVVPMTTEIVMEHQTVLIRGTEIVEIAAQSEIAPSSGAAVVSGTGKYLLPGLSDMHAHIAERSLPLYIANGVTLVRNMNGSSSVLDLRERVASGELLGPRIIAGSPILDGDPPTWPGSIAVTSPEIARTVVDELADAGYDFLKLYDGLSASTYAALIERARELEIPTAGHVPQSLTIDQVIDLRINSLEHLQAWDNAEASQGSPMEAALRGANFAEDLINMAAVAQRIESGEVELDSLFSQQRRSQIADRLAENGVWVVPTLVTYRAALAPRDEAAEWLARPEVRYVPESAREAWVAGTMPVIREIDDRDLHALQIYFDTWLERTKSLYEADVHLLIGTDAPGRMLVQGFSVHDELGYFVELGMTPFVALIAATRGPALFLGEHGGTVEVGSRADLLLLDANPLEDITATRRIAGVVLAGNLLDRAELDELLYSVEEAARSQ